MSHAPRTFAPSIPGWGCLGIALALAVGCARRESADAAGARDQVLQQALAAEPSDLDPQTIFGIGDYAVVGCLSEGLLVGYPSPPFDRPGVAASWEISADRKIYRFHLRPEARWSDGKPVTAGDFVRSYERILNPAFGSGYAYMLYVMAGAEDYHSGRLDDFSRVGVRALDERTLQIELRRPLPFFLEMLSHYAWHPVPIHVVEKFGGLRTRGSRWTRPGNFVGNGPFVLKDWKPGQVLLERSDTYWNRAQVRLAGIRFHPVENLDVQERMFRAGQLHRTTGVPTSRLDVWKREGPGELMIAPVLGTAFIRLNVNRPPFNDERVRRAFGLAIDREALATSVARAGQVPAGHLTPPDCQGYTARAGVRLDVAEARRLLAAAGYPDGRGFPAIEYLYDTADANREIAEALQEMWRENLGVSIILRNQEWRVYLSSVATGDYQMARGRWYADYIDPHNFLDLWVSQSGNNLTGWKNPAYDHLIDSALDAADNPARYEIYRTAEDLLLREMPVIPLYFMTQAALVKREVKGWTPSPYGTSSYRLMYLE